MVILSCPSCFSYRVETLNTVSRSFAMVIQQLQPEVRDAVCVFYLVLRALDSIEDDMRLHSSTKAQLLRQFHSHCDDTTYSRSDIGTKSHEQSLMRQYHKAATAFTELGDGYQRVIRNICRRMGHGMAQFCEKHGVDTYSDFNLYCHYVAGLVGIGLSQLFAETGSESLEFKQMEDLSNHMGLFLQKTNIIRDYKEDMEEGPHPRVWWPKEAWSKYASKLEDFLEESDRENAKACLNELIINALEHSPKCLEYMAKLKDVSIFRFCAIPQIMAIATLDRCFDNGDVFELPVKVPKGDVARINLRTTSMEDVRSSFAHYASSIAEKARVSNSLNAESARNAALAVVQATGHANSSQDKGRMQQKPHQNAIFAPLAGAYMAYAFNVRIHIMLRVLLIGYVSDVCIEHRVAC
jgi:farnesyl-diphosphate farnesyltransferase